MAAAIGIVMFLPQAIRIWKTKNTQSISLLTFTLIAAGSICWIVYGILLAATPVLLVNVVVLGLSAFIVAMKAKYK